MPAPKTNATTNEYERFTCFVSEDGLQRFKLWAKKQGLSMVKAKNKACEVLHPRVRAGFVPPKVWDRDCRRQGSWYRESSESGNYLIVSSVLLERMNGGTRLTFSDFSPPVLPNQSEVRELLQSAEYNREKPRIWEQYTEEDRLKFAMGRATIKQTLGEIPCCPNESFEDVFISHCANHSNFLSPRYYVKESDYLCPYSIADTFHVCSACLELFNLLGKQHRVKYIVPCPGAVTTAELPIHGYIRVTSIP